MKLVKAQFLSHLTCTYIRRQILYMYDKCNYLTESFFYIEQINKGMRVTNILRFLGKNFSLSKQWKSKVKNKTLGVEWILEQRWQVFPKDDRSKKLNHKVLVHICVGLHVVHSTVGHPKNKLYWTSIDRLQISVAHRPSPSFDKHGKFRD